MEHIPDNKEDLRVECDEPVDDVEELDPANLGPELGPANLTLVATTTALATTSMPALIWIRPGAAVGAAEEGDTGPRDQPDAQLSPHHGQHHQEPSPVPVSASSCPEDNIHDQPPPQLLSL